MIAIEPDLLRDTLAMLEGKQELVDGLVRLIDTSAPEILAADIRVELAQQSQATRDVIARVQEAFLP